DLATSGTSKVFEGDVAYLRVSLSDVGTSATRAAATRADLTYVNGSTSEMAINDAHFYFYDVNGDYVTEGEILGTSKSDGTNSDWEVQTSGGNVETTNSNVVLLEGLNGKEYPKYVVTLINAPENFTSPKTLAEWDAIEESDYLSGNNFMMSTSSYVENEDARPYPYVTELTDDDFTEETSVFEDVTGTPTVDIYVERLASKVGLKVNTADNSKLNALLDGGDGLAIKETLGDTNNTDGENVDQDETTLYVSLTGWALNATSDNIYMMKHIDSDWDFTDWVTDSWNDANNHRSYWAEGCSYDVAPDATTRKVAGLSYISFDDINNQLNTQYNADDVAYCLENTTTANGTGSNSVIDSKYSPAITGVLVGAQITEGKANANPTIQDFVRYKGVLYRLSDFYSAISYDCHVYTSNSKAPLTSAYSPRFDFTDNGDGTVSVKLKSGSGYHYYQEDGTEYEDIDAVNEKLNEDVDKETNVPYAQELSYYTDGYMYYIIPIEHLNSNNQDAEDGSIDEGDYGIVRNHYYQISIDGITNLGTGVKDPTAEIVPSENGVAKTAYDIISTVNVLSFVDVPEQSVTLK
ncbi:MAG: fimbria major subunit, partial [Prevotella sp.]|nr:fimbria major subunit [Prevotella sp.]